MVWSPSTPHIAASAPPSTHEDHEPDELCEGALAALPGDDVPLLRRADDDLGADDLVPRQLVVPRQLRDSDVVGRQTLGTRQGWQS